MSSRFMSLCLVSIACLSILGACASAAPATPLTPAERLATQAFSITDGSALLESLVRSAPPLSPPAPASAEVQAAWASPVDAWMQLGTQAVAASSQPEAARTLAYLAVALHDGLLGADLARAAGHVVSDDALLAALADTILTSHAPRAVDLRLVQTATWVGVWQQRSDAQAVANGIRLGQAVGAAVLSVAAADRADSASFAAPAVYRPNDPMHGGEPPLPVPAPGVWQLTPPSYRPPALPHWGALRPIGFVHLDDLNVVPPPAWDSRRFVQTREAFVQASAERLRAEQQRQLVDHARESRLQAQDDRAAALTTHDAQPVPVAVWMQQTHDLIMQAQPPLPTQDIAHIYAGVTVALHDGYILAYRGKYEYMVARPITWMQQTDPTWMPNQETPPTPSYPCDTAVASAAASIVLISAFPDALETLATTQRTLREAGVHAGIQWQIDVDAGNGLGEALGRRLVRQGSHP